MLLLVLICRKLGSEGITDLGWEVHVDYECVSHLYKGGTVLILNCDLAEDYTCIYRLTRLDHILLRYP